MDNDLGKTALDKTEPGKTASTPEPGKHPEAGSETEPVIPPADTRGPQRPAASHGEPLRPTPITPARVALSAKAETRADFNAAAPTMPQAYGNHNRQAPWWQGKSSQIFGFISLFALLLAVIFLLPNAVDPPEPAASAQPQPAAPIKPIESPFQEAQLAKQRREAQEILAEILDRQTKLEKMSVNLWAADTFARGMETAAAGDTNYRQRKFAEAQTLYRTSLDIFEQLIKDADGVFSEALNSGTVAIEAGNSELALKQLALALAIRPAAEEAQVEFARAQVLEQVLALVRDGQNLEREKQFERAQKQYEQALQLDGNSKIAAEKLAAVKQAIVDRDFSKAMSEGYAALHRNAYASAKKAFRKAIALKPGANEAATALTQTENQHTQTQINQWLETAQRNEQEEAWAKASRAYKKALDLDKSVVNARIGLIRTSTRNDFDQKIETILNDPLRLADETVYEQAQTLLAEAGAIPSPGPRLQQQIERLQQALQLAVAPVAVRLKSDNQTEVTVYRVGNLGNFIDREMTLKPGRYTAVGSREGYRDVRREFSVSPGSDVKTIVIQCVEKIALDG